MPTRVEKILKRARITLADQGADRWTDDTLLAFLDEGVKDFCEKTEMLNTTSLVELPQNSPYFPLPDDCWELTRASFNNTPLPFKTHKELDLLSCDWESHTGEPECVVYDRTDPRESRIYPIPDQINEIDTFGVVVGNLVDTQFGIVTGAVNLDVQDVYGVTTEVTLGLLCYYTKIPQDITALDSVIDTPPFYDRTLHFYVTGQAFLTDNDSGSQSKGAVQMQQYDMKVAEASESSTTDFTRAGQFETTYRKGV